MSDFQRGDTVYGAAWSGRGVVTESAIVRSVDRSGRVTVDTRVSAFGFGLRVDARLLSHTEGEAMLALARRLEAGASDWETRAASSRKAAESIRALLVMSRTGAR